MSSPWIPIPVPNELAPGAIVRVLAGERRLAALRHRGEWRVFDDACTHARCAFSKKGEVDTEQGILICNCHGAEFSLADGSVLLEPADVPLMFLPTRETTDGELEVQLD